MSALAVLHGGRLGPNTIQLLAAQYLAKKKNQKNAAGIKMIQSEKHKQESKQATADCSAKKKALQEIKRHTSSLNSLQTEN